VKDFFEPDSPLLEADVDRFAWIGSRVPELVFLYEVRKSFDEGNLLTESEVLLLSKDLEVEIWPLNSWASRGSSLEHSALLDLYIRTNRTLEVKQRKEILREFPEIILTEDEIEGMEHEEFITLVSDYVNRVKHDEQARYDAIWERFRQERADRLASKSPQQISYENSVTQILDITFSLNSAITEQDKIACQRIVQRASEAIDSAPASLCESSIYLNLKTLIEKANELGV